MLFFLVGGGVFLKCFLEGEGKANLCFLVGDRVLISTSYMHGLYLWLPALKRNRLFPRICVTHIKPLSILEHTFFAAAFVPLILMQQEQKVCCHVA